MNSLLDRITEPFLNKKSQYNSTHRKEKLFESIRQDLENLLNTKKPCITIPNSLSELKQSIYSYGLADFLRAKLDSDNFLDIFSNEIISAIEKHEPRLSNVKISFDEKNTKNSVNNSLSFYLEALLLTDENVEEIRYESNIEQSTKKIILKPKSI